MRILLIIPFYLFFMKSALAIRAPHEAALDAVHWFLNDHPQGKLVARNRLSDWASDKLDGAKDAFKNAADTAIDLLVEALAGDEPKTYAPTKADCPKDLEWITPADKLVKGEEDFLKKREKVVKGAVEKIMKRNEMPNPPRTPVIGYAISGGGYRSMITGLGGLMGLMEDSQEAKDAGTAGWSDAITYMAGLSGGSWGTASWISNGGQLPLDLIDNVWNLSSNLIFPDDEKIDFYASLINQVNGKRDSGLPVQLTDYWALALGEHLFPKEYRIDKHADLTISQLPQKVDKLGKGELPMPIVIASQREEGETVVAENSTVWEFTPFSFGSWAFGSQKKVPGGFTPVEYLGSKLSNGKPDGDCKKGVDRLGYVIGTSATLFNGLLLQLNQTDSDEHGSIMDGLKYTLRKLSEDKFDVSRIPNPFRGWSEKEDNPLKDFELLTLVDAGETNQNIALEPLIMPERNVDAIIAFDGSKDTETSWPNGTSIHTTFNRAVILNEGTDTPMKMPKVPSPEGFVKGKLNTRPTFFGCEDTTTPLIVYIPQSPWTYYSNKSTFQLDYDNTEAKETMLNGMRSVTLNNTINDWPVCLACAMIDRSFSYTKENRTDTCKKCFENFCWDGKEEEKGPKEYNPVLGVPDWFEEKKLVKPDKGDGAKGTNKWKDKESSGLDAGGIGKWFTDLIANIAKKL